MTLLYNSWWQREGVPLRKYERRVWMPGRNIGIISRWMRLASTLPTCHRQPQWFSRRFVTLSVSHRRPEEDFNIIPSRSAVHLCLPSSSPPSCSLFRLLLPPLPLRPNITPLWPRDTISTHIRVVSIDLSRHFIKRLPLPLIALEPSRSSRRPRSICLMKADPHISQPLVWGFWWWWCPLVKGCEKTLGARRIDREPPGGQWGRSGWELFKGEKKKDTWKIRFRTLNPDAKHSQCCKDTAQCPLGARHSFYSRIMDFQSKSFFFF